jgi:hypothetical protein
MTASAIQYLQSGQVESAIVCGANTHTHMVSRFLILSMLFSFNFST